MHGTLLSHPKASGVYTHKCMEFVLKRKVNSTLALAKLDTKRQRLMIVNTLYCRGLYEVVMHKQKKIIIQCKSDKRIGDISNTTRFRNLYMGAASFPPASLRCIYRQDYI